MSEIDYDATGLKPTQFAVVPKGRYHVIISDYTEKTTSAGDPMWRVTMDIDEKEHVGSKIWHNVTLLPRDRKGAGITLHFLKTIGEPFEGRFKVNSLNWIGKRLLVDVYIEEYPEKSGKFQNKVAAVWPVTDGKLYDPTVRRQVADTNDEQVPF